jgi:hypothetical protein
MEHFLLKFFLGIYFSQIQTITMHEEFHRTALNCNVLVPKIFFFLAKFEPTIFCSVGGDDDHYLLYIRRRARATLEQLPAVALFKSH